MVALAFPGRVIFDHQQKTGGTAVVHWLRDTLGTGCVTRSLIGEHDQLIKLYGGRHSIISGHIKFKSGDELDPRYQYITCFREPIDRALSSIFHAAAKSSIHRNIVPRFLQSDGEFCPPEFLKTISNVYVKHLCSINRQEKFKNNNSRVEHSLTVLKSFDVVGLYEKNAEFIEKIASLINIVAPSSLQRVNVTQNRLQVDQISSALRQRLESWNRLDLIFYSELLNSKRPTVTPTSIPKVWHKMALKDFIITRAAGSLSIATMVNSLNSGESKPIRVKVYNKSNLIWMSKVDTKNGIYASYHWLDSSGKMHIYEGKRTSLPDEDIFPDCSLSFDMTVTAPSESGSYTLVATLLQQGSAWFENIGFEPGTLQINVT